MEPKCWNGNSGPSFFVSTFVEWGSLPPHDDYRSWQASDEEGVFSSDGPASETGGLDEESEAEDFGRPYRPL
jgi:hypothetical protein